MRIQFVAVVLINICIKILLFPSYKSTDFEVHRNWLAITHSTPLNQWYFEDTSIWTLDYPPFFAYFQYLLSVLANLYDPRIVELHQNGFDSVSTTVFMRGSVIGTDLLLAWAAWLFVSGTTWSHHDKLVIFTLIVFNAGLLLVDHMHFQYNGVLMALLLLCVHLARSRRYIWLAALFSLLVLAKHLFVLLAPVFAAFLLINFCCLEVRENVECFVGSPSGSLGDNTLTTKRRFSFVRFFQLCTVAFSALLAAFGPFLLQHNPREQLLQLFSRLFPFGRGLVHAYWAPNVWALYCATDKLGSAILSNVLGMTATGTAITDSPLPSSSSGIVGDFALYLLPRPSALHCMGLLGLCLLPVLWRMSSSLSQSGGVSSTLLLRGLVCGSLSAFMVGYHVHEKAIIAPVLLQTLLARVSLADGALFLLLSSTGTYGLFPLFEGSPELLVKATVLVAYMAVSFQFVFRGAGPSGWTSRGLRIGWGLLIALFLFTEVVHPMLAKRSDGTIVLPFLPLMATSVVCAIQLLIAWGFSFHLMCTHKET